MGVGLDKQPARKYHIFEMVLKGVVAMRDRTTSLWLLHGNWKVTKATESRKVIVGRMCSNCGNPVLSEVEIRAQVTRNYWLFMPWLYAKEELQKTAWSAHKVAAEVAREIEICKRDHKAISRRPHAGDGISWGNAQEGEHWQKQTSCVVGLNDACPNCMHFEPWMPERLSSKRLEQLREENFPEIFETLETAQAWAWNKVSQIAADVSAARGLPGVSEIAVKKLPELKEAITQQLARKAVLPEMIEKEQLEQQEQMLQKKQSEIGIFSFAEKKKIRSELALIQYRLKENREKLLSAQKPIEEQLQRLHLQLQEVLRLVNGCEAGVLCKRSGKTIVFHPQVEGFTEWDVFQNLDLSSGQREEIEDFEPIPVQRYPENFGRSLLAGLGAVLKFFLMICLVGGTVDALAMFVRELIGMISLSGGERLFASVVYLLIMGIIDYVCIAAAIRKKK